MVLVSSTPQYTIIRSRDVDRLIARFALVRYDLRDDKIMLATDDPDLDKIDMSYQDYELYPDDQRPLFLHLPWTQNVIYASSHLDVDKYSSDIVKIVQHNLSQLPHRDILVFDNRHGESFDYLDLLWRQCHLDNYANPMIGNPVIYFQDGQLFAFEYNTDG